MRRRRRKVSALGTVIDALAGVAGGLVGSFAIGKLVENQGKLPEKLRGPAMAANPADVVLGEAEKLTHERVPEATKPAAGQVLHYLYGTTGPALLGIIARRAGINRSLGRTLAFGAGLGVLVWAIGYLGWLPAAGVVEPIEKQGATHVASSVLGHAGYGILSALPLAASGRIG
jgi:hypothetical protein